VSKGLWVTVIGFAVVSLVSLAMPKSRPAPVQASGSAEEKTEALAVNRHM